MIRIILATVHDYVLHKVICRSLLCSIFSNTFIPLFIIHLFHPTLCRICTDSFPYVTAVFYVPWQRSTPSKPETFHAVITKRWNSKYPLNCQRNPGADHIVFPQRWSYNPPLFINVNDWRNFQCLKLLHEFHAVFSSPVASYVFIVNTRFSFTRNSNQKSHVSFLY